MIEAGMTIEIIEGDGGNELWHRAFRRAKVLKVVGPFAILHINDWKGDVGVRSVLLDYVTPIMDAAYFAAKLTTPNRV